MSREAGAVLAGRGRHGRSKNVDVQDGCKLVIKHAFGVHGPLRDNVMFVESENEAGVAKECLLYPVGQHGE